MSTRFLPALVLVAALSVTTTLVFADALIKPIPTPDLSKLSSADASALREISTTFEQKKATLVGEPLAEAYALLGAAYLRYGFPEAAAVALEDASLLAPDDGRWVYARGVLARAQKQDAVAQNLFELALQLDQEYLPIQMAVARSKVANGDVEGARKLLADYVVAHTDQAAAYALLADIALRQKRYAEAITHARRALVLDPKATSVYATLADAQAGAGNAKAATDARAKVGNVAPVLADPLAEGLLGLAGATPASPAVATDPALEHVRQAGTLLQLRQYDAARKQLDSALQRRPNDATVLALYARVEAAAGNLSAAKSRAAAAVAADRENALAHLSQGVVLEMSMDDAGALRAYEQAVRLGPKLAEVRSILGALLLRTGRNEDAITQYRALVQLDARSQESWMSLVAGYVIVGRCGDALRDVSDMLGLDANNTFMLQLFVRLASTCPAASANERRGALEYGEVLYRGNASAPISEAYALALAANGRWDDAVKTQQAAMFALVRAGGKAAVAGHRETLAQLQAHKLPNRPWSASAVVFHPPRLAPDPKPVATPPRR